MSASTMIKGLMQKKQMERAIALRSAETDEDIKAVIKQIVEVALVAQTTNRPRMMQTSIKELDQTVLDLVNRNVRVSDKLKKNIVRKLTNLSDDLSKQLEDGVSSSSSGGGGSSFLPSFDNITSAIMTANPALGYGARMIQTAGESIKSAKGKKLERSRTERDNQVRASSFLDDDEAEVSDLTQESPGSGGSNMGGDSSVVNEHLDRIYKELVTLNDVWGDGTRKTNDTLSDLVRVEEEMQDEQRLKREQDEINHIEAMRRQEEANSGGGGPIIDPEADGDGGFLNSILGGGMGGAIMAAVTGIASFFGPIMASSGLIFKLAAKAAIIPAIIYSIYQFIEGFFNAASILGMSESDVTISDRIAAGIGSVVDGFLSLINSIVGTVLGWFGMDVDFMPENSKELISNAIKGVFDYYLSIFDDFLSLFGFGPEQEQSIFEGIKGIVTKVIAIPLMLFNAIGSMFGMEKVSFEDIKTTIGKGISSVVHAVTALPMYLLNAVAGLFGFDEITRANVVETVGNGIKSIADGVVAYVNGYIDLVVGIFDAIPSFDEASDFMSSIGDTIDSVISSIKDGISGFIKSKFDGIISFFSGGDSEDSASPRSRGDIKRSDGFIDETTKSMMNKTDSARNSLEPEYKQLFGNTDSGSSKTSETMNKANRSMREENKKNAVGSANIVNAPSSTTNVSNNTRVETANNTSNPDPSFRESYSNYSYSFMR